MRRRRADWDFPYAPIAPAGPREDSSEIDVVVATTAHVAPARVTGALASLGTADAQPLLDEEPLHWMRVRCAARAARGDVTALLSRAGIGVRYLASARASDTALAPALDLTRAPRATPRDWPRQRARRWAEPPSEGTRWFLGPRGAAVERGVCGTGAGARLAVIDDDARDAESLGLQKLVLIAPAAAPSTASGHGGLMAAWASSALRAPGGPFAGVAPDASTRLYLIPKPGADVVSFPLALVRAALDGADVIVCATYLEATTSPMLDDALDVVTRLGRRGRGTLVLLPTGRETSSAGTSLHASLSLALGDPASDPRVGCVAPSGVRGGWFLWRDARGLLRPFANRGPAVRWLAPGDDLAYPFGARDRLFHAESSGASAVAAGVAALVLARNPTLRLRELHAVLARTAQTPEPDRPPDAALADPVDLLPVGRDRDGHDARHGYGRLDATGACLAAGDPLSLAMSAMGEARAAAAWSRCERPYSPQLARWAVRALLADPDLEHGVRALVRHARLVGASPARAAAHGAGALARQLGLLVRRLTQRRGAPPSVRAELEAHLAQLIHASVRTSEASATFERATTALCVELWGGVSGAPVPE